MTAHALIAPSSLAITLQCAASVRLQRLAPDVPTPESIEGDDAHWLAALAATGIDPQPFLNTPAPKGTLIDQDMIDGAVLWADTVGTEGIAETRVAIPRIHPECWGTPDNRRYDPLAQVLRVYDYKYGHRTVEVFENAQLAAYAAGCMDELNLPWTHQTYIRFAIVQPRAYGPGGPVREWGCYAHELLPLLERLRAAAHAAAQPEAAATTGPECVDCKARHLCPLFQSVAARIVDASGRADIHELAPDQLGAELSYLDAAIERLKARRDGLAVQAEVHLRGGKAVPGYEMGEGRSVEKWTADVPTVSAFSAALGVPLVREPELLTPKQSRDAFKRRKLAPELLDAFIHRPPGKLALRQSDTIRARKAFTTRNT